MSSAIEAIGLTKRYGEFTAVDDLYLDIPEGEVYGFLGPNGAGKTTTILMLLGLTEPTAGTARVAGFSPIREPLKMRRLVGYLPENVGFYGDLTARENLLYTADLNGIPYREAMARIKEVLERVGLEYAVDKPVRQFSRGMRQRLGIADVLIKRPRVVFLDEPTLGIDPVGVEEVLAIIRDMPKDGITVMITSHLLHQIQQVCDRVGIMSGGKLVAEGPIDSLGNEVLKGADINVELVVGRVDEDLLAALRTLPGVHGLETEGNTLHVQCKREARPELALAVVQRGVELHSMRATDLALQEIYLRYFQEA